jgi:Rieske Fe-S protein
MTAECASCLARRSFLVAAAAAGATGLAGCQVYGAAEQPAPAAPPAPAETPPSGRPAETPDHAAAPALAQLADIPVEGGKVFPDQKVVVTQPAAGTVKAFSAVCTHAGCLVSEVSDGTINCACHGSMFRIADGSVAKGPAGKPLSPVGVAVQGTAVTLV